MKSVTVPMGEFALGVNIQADFSPEHFDFFDIDAEKLASLAVAMDAPAAIERRLAIEPSAPPALVINFARGSIVQDGRSTLGFYDSQRYTQKSMPSADITILPLSALSRQVILNRSPISKYETINYEQANELIAETVESVVRHELRHFADPRWDFMYDNSRSPKSRLAGHKRLIKAQIAEAETDPLLGQMKEKYRELAGPWYKAMGKLVVERLQLEGEAIENMGTEMLFGHSIDHKSKRQLKAIELKREIKIYKEYYLLPIEVEARASESLHKHIGRFATIGLSELSLSALNPQLRSRLLGDAMISFLAIQSHTKA